MESPNTIGELRRVVEAVSEKSTPFVEAAPLSDSIAGKGAVSGSLSLPEPGVERGGSDSSSSNCQAAIGVSPGCSGELRLARDSVSDHWKLLCRFSREADGRAAESKPSKPSSYLSATVPCRRGVLGS